MAMIQLNTKPTPRQLQQFAGLLLPVVMFVIATVVWWRGGRAAWTGMLVVVGVAIAASGWWRPGWWRWPYVTWMAVAFPLGWLISHLLLAMVFYGVVTPIGLVLRLMGRDPLQRRFEKQKQSYWEPCDRESSTDRYFRQF